MATLYSNADATESSLTLIESQVLGVAAASVTFSAIPQTYKHLRLLLNARTAVVDESEPLDIEFNGDTGANYKRAYHWAGSTEGAVVDATSNICGAMGASAPSDRFKFTVLEIGYYAGATHKITNAFGGEFRTSNGYIQPAAMLWNNTAAITSILLKSDSGANFVAGSRFDLYGIK